MSVKKNRISILPHCKFLCDGKLDNQLDEYELIRFLPYITLYVAKKSVFEGLSQK